MRISCAIPRASLRSVFTIIAFSAALTWRVSIKIAGSPFAEVVFVVDEKYQRPGIASFLYRMLIRLAKKRGLKGFVAEVLYFNIGGIVKVFKKGDLPVKAHLEGGVYHLEIPFASVTKV